jgi:abequosyltransferase
MLLGSVDCDPSNVEIVICEDFSPQKDEIRKRVNEFRTQSPFKVRYIENNKNKGFDGNIRELVAQARGKFILFMGDDDLFIPLALDQFLNFLTEHINVKYILRSYVVVHPDGSEEPFRYMTESTVLPPGEGSVAWLFKRSVTICGFTISRKEALKHATADLDGTLLYQIYLMSKVCLEHPSVYCDIPVAQAVLTWQGDYSMFGNAEAEKSRFTPGSVTGDNSINFTKNYFEVTDYLDQAYGTHLTKLVRQSLSKYSYPFLSIQRKRGIKLFLLYANRLEKECGFGVTPYFYIYKWALVFMGEKFCDWTIRLIKRASKHTPNL